MKDIKIKDLKVVVLDSKEAPKLLSQVEVIRTPSGKIVSGKFKVKLIHPNTKEIIHEEEIKALDAYKASEYASQLKDDPRFNFISTWYQEVKFIPQPKKGKMKLETEKGIIEGDTTTEEYDLLETTDADFVVDAEFLELDKQVSKSIEKRDKKAAKVLKATKKAPKKAIKAKKK